MTIASCFSQRKNEARSIPNLVTATAEDISRLDIGVDIDSKPETTTVEVEVPTQSALECKCGMPLCICTTVLPDPVPEVAIMQRSLFHPFSWSCSPI